MPFTLLKASLRNYRRILLLSTGIILAISLIAGVNIGVEAISKGVLASYIQSTPFDMTLTQNDVNISYTQINQKLTSIQEIRQVETIFSWPLYNSANLTSKSATLSSRFGSQFIIVGMDAAFASRYNVTMIQGRWNFTQGVVLPANLANALKVNNGDRFNASIGYYNGKGTSYWNTSFQVAGVAIFDTLASALIPNYFGVTPISLGPSSINSPPGGPIIMSYDALKAAFSSFKTTASKSGQYYAGSYVILYRIFLNREAVINLFDADSTLVRLVGIENAVRIQVGNPSFSLEDHVINAIDQYRFWLQSNLTGFYFFSLPVLPISWYLAMTSWFMVTSRRRQEFGLLKVRGVSGRRIFWSAILESVVIGILGSVLGTIAGLLVGAVVALMLGSPASLAITPTAITPTLLVFSAVVGIFISVLASIRPARLAAAMQPTEAMKEYQGEELEVGKPWRPTWTWAAMSLGAYKMLEWIFNFNPMTIFPNGPPTGNFLVAIAFFIWASLSGILIILGPFLFVYGLTKIVTRSQNRLYMATTLLLRTFIKDLANITARGLSRNPARASRVAFLIALTLTFGIFINVVFASTYDLQIRSNRLQVGADLNVRTYSGLNETFVSNLTSVQGIADATPVSSGSSSTLYSGVQSVSVYGVNAGNFLDVAYADEDFTVGSAVPLFQKMQATPNATLLSEGLAQYLNLKAGDAFEITQPTNGTTTTIRFVVIGFLRSLPGVGTFAAGSGTGPSLGTPSGIGQYFYGGVMLTSISYLRKSNFANVGTFFFLCKLKSNADPQQVSARITSLYGSKIGHVDTFQQRMQQFSSNAAATSIFKFLQLTSGYLFLAAVLGFAVISWANTNDRLNEIAIFRSRGTSRRQALQILFAESFAILLLALLIGVGTGVLSSYGVLRFFTSSLTSTSLSGLSLRLIVPLELWIMLVASIGGFLLSILLSAWLSLRKPVVQTIRFR